MTRVKEFSHFFAIFLMAEVQLVMPLSAVKVEVVFRFGNFAFQHKATQNQMFCLSLYLLFFVCYRYNYCIVCFRVVFYIYSYVNTDKD